MKADALFTQLETWHGKRDWGTVLDAGTGEHSLRWLLSLPTASVTAITAASQRREHLMMLFQKELREHDVVLNGNWLNQLFLTNSTYDVVIADYLLGAVEGFAPYFQNALFSRLHRHCRKDLYVVGQEPFPQYPATSQGKLVQEIHRLRDSCILLAGHNCYREYPRSWVISNLESSGFIVHKQKSFPIRIDKYYLQRQLQVCENKLPFFKNKMVAREMLFYITEIKQRVSDLLREQGTFLFGEDYAIQATVIRRP